MARRPTLPLVFSFLLLLVPSQTLGATAPTCPNLPAGRLEQAKFPKICPLPGQLGIVQDADEESAITWSLPPRCMVTGADKNATDIHCLLTSTEFRAGHGTSLVVSTTVAANLVGLGAFDDRPMPLVALKREAELGPAYKIVDVEGKGKGVVATRAIRRGEIIMVDVPAVMVGVDFLGATKPHHRRRILKQAIRQLPEETRERVLGLYKSPGEYEIDNILGPNSETVLLAEDKVHVGVFTEAARINHSCRPNAYYRFSERRLTMEIVSYHAIEAGEEIVMSYVPLRMEREERRKYLLDHWGFDCKCSLCHGTKLEIEDSESWRRRMTDLKATVLDARREGFYQDAINMAGEWLMFSEWDRVPPLMHEYHDTVGELYLLNGDLVNATRHGRIALDGWARFGSVDDEQLEKARVFLRHVNRVTEEYRRVKGSEP